MHQLIFVTGNQHKFAEVQNFLESNNVPADLRQSALNLKELQANTLEEVAKFKILSVIDDIHPPYFIEDAGFFVDDVCNGFPGVYSSYVMKTIGCEGVLRILADSPNRNAHFESVIAYLDKHKQIHIFKGENHGKVSSKARGTSGFGFDPIFISNDTSKNTFAELTIEEKNLISHRRRAMMKFIDHLKKSAK